VTALTAIGPEKALFSSPIGWAALDVLLFGTARHARARRALPGQGPAGTAVVHGLPMDDCLVDCGFTS
jgi:hypothetical protein